LNPLNPVFKYKITAMTAALSKYSHVSLAQTKANYLMYVDLLKQSSLWSFMDTFRIFGLICFLIIPILFFMKSPKTTSGDDNLSNMH